MKKSTKIISLILSLVITCGIVFSVPVYAYDIPTRTVMMYCVGADLEAYDQETKRKGRGRARKNVFNKSLLFHGSTDRSNRKVISK